MAQTKPDRPPLDEPTLARLAADTVRKAHAVGLMDDEPDFADLSYATVRKVISRVREAGVGAYAAGNLARADLADTDAIVRELRRIEALICRKKSGSVVHRRLAVLARGNVYETITFLASAAGRAQRGPRPSTPLGTP